MSDRREPDLEDRLAASAGRAAPWLLPVAVLLLMQVKWWWVPGDDASVYLSIARHLAHGELRVFDSPHLRWAPGYPLVIAPAFWTSERPFLVISLIHFVLALLMAIAVFLWFRRLVPAAAGMLTALVMVNPAVWELHRRTLSELAFATWMTWAVYAMWRGLEARPRTRAAGWAAAAAGLLVLACYTRHVGIFLAGGFGVAAALMAAGGRITWRRAVASTLAIGGTATAALLVLVLWDRSMAARVATGVPSYLHYFRDPDRTLAGQLLEGVRMRMSGCGQMIIPGMYKAYAGPGEWLHVNTLIYGGLAVALVAGWWRLARRRRDPLLFAAPLYLAFFIAWPHSPGPRYLMPLLPVLILCLWALSAPLRRARLTTLLVVIVAHTGVSVAYWIRGLDHRKLHALWPGIVQLVEPMREHPEGAALQDVDPDRRLMMRFCLNRRLVREEDDATADDRPRWIIRPAGQPAPPTGYARRSEGAGLELLGRVSP